MALKYPIYRPIAKWAMHAFDVCLSLIIRKQKRALVMPEKILINNCAHLGDVILTTAILAPLKAAYPRLKIGMVVGSWSKEALEKHPLIDWVHTVDHWKTNRARKKRFFHYLKTRRFALREIKKMRYGASIDCNFHFPNMAPLMWQAKIPIRVGFETAGFGPFLTHALPWNPEKNVSACHAFFSLIKSFPHVERFKTLLKPNLSCTFENKESYLIIHIGTGDPKKEWPKEKWRQLVQKLLSDGFRLVFTGKGKKEREMISYITSGLPNILNLCDQLNWEQFVSSIQKSILLISVDSAAGHIAAAVETPSILICPAIHPEFIWRPFSQKCLLVTQHVPCSPCFKGCAAMACIHEVSSDEVYKKALFYLSKINFLSN